MHDAKPTVFIVDDDASVRASLEFLMDSAGWQSQTFASGNEFLSCPRTLSPSCLVLDAMLPDINGLDIQKRVVLDHFDMPIIFISGHSDVPMTVQAMKAGAIEFLTKPVRDDVLLGAIKHAIERSSAALDHKEESQGIRSRYASLTPRERQVIALVTAGLLNKQVGSELGISEITVKVHRGNVMRKMKARSFAELVNMVAKLGLTPSPKRRSTA